MGAVRTDTETRHGLRAAIAGWLQSRRTAAARAGFDAVMRRRAKKTLAALERQQEAIRRRVHSLTTRRDNAVRAYDRRIADVQAAARRLQGMASQIRRAME